MRHPNNNISNKINIEVVYSPKQNETTLLNFSVPANWTIGQALKSSQIFEIHPELLNTAIALKIGVFGKHRSQEDLLEAGDRIEIYRSLIIDPKAARFKRVKRSATII